MDPNDEIAFEMPNVIVVYKSGRVDRLFHDQTVPASLDPITGVASKDVVIDIASGISARLYLPKHTGDPRKKLPVLVYYHGGAFCIGSAFSSWCHSYINSLVAKANVMAVSVDYRLAPEHPLPAGYDDSWQALQWVVSHKVGGPEGWLADHGDFGRVFLAGDSAGATIAHQMAMRAGEVGLQFDVKIKGVVLTHPYFLGAEEVESELIDPVADRSLKELWKLACPTTSGLDDSLICPMAEGAPSLMNLGCEKVLVCVAEMDVLRDRGRAYHEVLRNSGYKGEVEMLEVEQKGHCFHIAEPHSEQSLAQGEKICSFMNSN